MKKKAQNVKLTPFELRGANAYLTTKVGSRNNQRKLVVKYFKSIRH